MRFEWNSSKAQFNFSKHGISFEEATTIFGDPLSLTSPDPDHSQEEARWITIGVSTNFKTIVVVHTDPIRDGKNNKRPTCHKTRKGML